MIFRKLSTSHPQMGTVQLVRQSKSRRRSRVSFWRKMLHQRDSEEGGRSGRKKEDGNKDKRLDAKSSRRKRRVRLMGG